MAETMALGIPTPTPSPNQLQTTTPLGVNGFVIDDAKRVEIITDRGEAAHRSRPGYAHRQDIRTDKLGTTDSINITNLADQLYEDRAVFGPGREIWFIPRASFDAILTPEVIVQVVNQLACYQNMNPDERIQVASDIYYGKDPSSGVPRPPCRKLLATLIGARADGTSLETVEEIKTHMDEGMNDDCLPLFFDGDNQLKCRLHGQNHPFINRPKRGRGQWKESFVRWSRALTAPYVLWDEAPESRHRHYVMLDGGPLPMAPVWEESVPHVHHGGFGDVLKVKIQIGDRNFQGPRGEDSFFALKKLKENGDAARVEFDLEVRSLIFTENRTNNVPGPNDTETKKHVIQLLASFEVYDSNLKHPTYYLLFPWADGNLEEFWRRHDKKYSPRDQGQISWTIDQFYHLAKALQCLHNDRQVNLSQRTDSNRYGRHGDIKPGNFLFFRDSDGVGVNLVLADFGLGRLHSKASKSKQSPNVPKTATYAAPEYDIDGGRLSPRSDIFSLGCVLLEHMVWFFHGHSAVEAFTDERMAVDHYGFESDTFWKASDPDGKSAEIKDTVSKRLAALKKRDDCVEAIGEILEVIEKKMLQARPADRCTSLNLVLNWTRSDATGRAETRTTPPGRSLSRKSTLNVLQPDGIIYAEPPSRLDGASASPDSPSGDLPKPAEPVIGPLVRSKPLAREEPLERSDLPELSEPSERRELPESSNPPKKSESLERNDPPERSEPPEKREPPESSEPQKRNDPAKRSDLVDPSKPLERNDPQDRSESLEKSEPPERGKLPESSEPPNRNEPPGRGELPESSELQKKNEPPERSDIPESSEPLDKSELPDRTEPLESSKPLANSHPSTASDVGQTALAPNGFNSHQPRPRRRPERQSHPVTRPPRPEGPMKSSGSPGGLSKLGMVINMHGKDVAGRALRGPKARCTKQQWFDVSKSDSVGRVARNTPTKPRRPEPAGSVLIQYFEHDSSGRTLVKDSQPAPRKEGVVIE
ncbi:hypothetical protein CHGG_04226 [Chaetomium globosum CBS 148.51]|uniref:non-specific serine/threonine protein kinase n=1 Tax=Chaetomium globosum (strain ATCC 6205 / CBS 148.51 / DSM 1962 / NBRC 6347 / NRRL 1970) TaxID=306901 RepID=Q2H1X0_CHAGB|nr:uncharacterized protein CHGG_04226 [Chaetomium globosum CBS 148.51]EAQ87607.1 hypothetical protein CHGG_04226 [Chaetomium globosum CBS 148.51]